MDHVYTYTNVLTYSIWSGFNIQSISRFEGCGNTSLSLCEYLRSTVENNVLCKSYYSLPGNKSQHPEYLIIMLWSHVKFLASSISWWILRRLWFGSQMELGLAVLPLGPALKQQRSSMLLVCASSFSIDSPSYDFLMLPVTATPLDVTTPPLIQ